MENETPNYYAIIPADVRYDERLKANEKLMYGEITCLSNKLGYCFSSNNYFAELYNVTPQAISGWIKNLERCGYISCEYLHNGTEIKERRIRMTNSRNDEKGNSTKLEKGINETLTGYKQNFKDNNTRYNNIKNNNTSDCIPAYIQEPLKTNKDEFQSFLSDAFVKILNHNKWAKHKIPISKNLLYFTQKEGRELLELSRQYEISEIKSALENYLKVANSETWKSGFSFNAFCKNIAEYIPDYFDMSKYIDTPKGGLDELAENTVNEMIEAGYVFRIPVFYKHKEEWFNMGMPKGEKLVQIVKEWTDKEDNQ